MTTTVIEPGDTVLLETGAGIAEPVVVLNRRRRPRRRGWFSRSRRWFRRMTTAAWARTRSGMKRIRNSAVSASRVVQAKAKAVGASAARMARTGMTKIKNAGAWSLRMTRTAGQRSWSGLKWTGRGALRVLGYIGYAFSLAYGWMLQSVQGALLLTTLGTLAVLLSAIMLVGWLADGYKSDAKWYRKISQPRGEEGSSKIPMLKKRRFFMKKKQRTRLANRVSTVLVGKPVHVQTGKPVHVQTAKGVRIISMEELKEALDDHMDEIDTEFDDMFDELYGNPAPEVDSIISTEMFEPTRSGEYGGKFLREVLVEHEEHLKKAIEKDDRSKLSYWSGRITFLKAMMEDEDNLTQLEAIYQGWKKDQDSGDDPKFYVRGQFHKGMVEERAIFRREVEIENTPQEGPFDIPPNPSGNPNESYIVPRER